jgi:hypothetical protein
VYATDNIKNIDQHLNDNNNIAKVVTRVLRQYRDRGLLGNAQASAL